MNEPAQRGITFRPEDYKEAAEEHILTAQDLWEAGSYVMSIYVAGVAAEAMFRGYHGLRSREFDSRHDLNEWAKKSGFIDIVPMSDFEKYSVARSNMVFYWSNNHRYRSQAALRKYYKRLDRNRKIKGDMLKEIARRTVNAALDIISLGKEKWKSSSVS